MPVSKIVRRFLLILLTVLFVIPQPTAAALEAGTERYFMTNGGYHFNPDSVSACAASTVSGTTNIEKIWNFFISKGLSGEQAAGILGNLQAEGGFSATRQEDSQSFPGGGWGIAQWTGGRRTTLVAAVRNANLDQYYDAKYGGPTAVEKGYVADGLPIEASDKILALELDFLYQESTTRIVRNGWGLPGKSEWESVKAAKTVLEASDIWLYSFERPRDQSATVSSMRAKNGTDILNKLAGTSGGVASSSGCSSVDSSGSEQALLDLVKKYAWPTYSSVKTDKMPDYQKAVTSAKQNGIYVGNDGVDCGGFVTLLMINSGFEPNYNFGGKFSQGAGITDTQEAWARKNWKLLGTGSTIDTSTLRPGDVAFLPGHTFVYIGGKVPGWDSKYVVASASNGRRSPMAGHESLTDPNVTWFRKN